MENLWRPFHKLGIRVPHFGQVLSKASSIRCILEERKIRSTFYHGPPLRLCHRKFNSRVNRGEFIAGVREGLGWFLSYEYGTLLWPPSRIRPLDNTFRRCFSSNASYIEVCRTMVRKILDSFSIFQSGRSTFASFFPLEFECKTNTTNYSEPVIL